MMDDKINNNRHSNVRSHVRYRSNGRFAYSLMVAMLLLISLAIFASAAAAQQEGTAGQDGIVDIHAFVGETCPHCAELEEHLDALKEEYDFINPTYYEVYYNAENKALFEQMAEEHGIKVQGVPTFFIGDKHFVGYSSRMDDDILEAIFEARGNNGSQNNSSGEKPGSNETIKLPIIGEIDPSSISLPVLTVLLGFLDGFNPCAFFVLLFLLSMLVYAKSKSRMLIIGLTFVFFSGLIYFLFMSAWLNFFMVTKNITIITTIAGIVALIIAVINIKDFFAFKKGVSLSVSDKHRDNLISRMRNLLKAESMTSMMIGTIALAVAANMYELLCTAGFPMVFTKILVLNELSTLSYYSYLLLYNLIYVLPLLTIVLIFTYTFGAKRLSQAQGEALKLLSGMMMLALGGMLVFAPGLLNNVVAAVGTILFAIALTATIIIMKNIFSKPKEGEEGDKPRGVRKR